MTVILSFILVVVLILCGTSVLIFMLAKCDNINTLDSNISLKGGIQVKSLFYKK